MDNPGQIVNLTLRDNREVRSTTVKGLCQRQLGTSDDEKAFAIIASAQVILIYGSSIGRSDMRWWKAVVDRLREENGTLVVIYKYIPEGLALTPRRCYEEKGKLFRAAGVVDNSEFELLEKRVYVVPSSKLFSCFKGLSEGKG